MERNLDRRVEVVTPVEDDEAQARLARIIDVMLADDRRSWQLGPDGRWRRTEIIESIEGTIDTFAVLKEDAASSVGARGAAGPGRGGRRVDGPARMTDLLEAHPLEVELKYRMTDVATGERLLATDDLAGFAATGPAETVRHEDRYLDTDDGALEAAGYAGRLRSTGRGTIITLKGLERQDDGGATHRREELEGPADPAMPPRAVAAVHRARRGGRDRRRPDAARPRRRSARCAASATTRATARSSRSPSTTSRCMVGAQVAERFAELELELRDGEEVDLEPLADMLGEIEELVAVDSSKFERALEVVRREPREAEDERRSRRPSETPTPLPGSPSWRPAPHSRSGAQRRKRRKAALAAPPELVAIPIEPDAEAEGSLEAPAPATEAPADAPRILVPKSPGVLADDHLAEAGRKVLRFHLARMVAREAGTREGKDAEELHAMRVATRRQRAAWRVFGDAFDPKRTARHRRRLRLVAADLGAVRDLDVLIESIEAYQGRQSEDESAALEPLVRSWRMRREAARGVLVRELDAERYTRWLDSYLAFVQSEGQGVHAVGPTEAAPRPRHDAVADLERLRGGSRLRVGDALGRRGRRSTSCGSPPSGCATPSSSCARRSAATPGRSSRRSSRSRTTSGWLHDADVAAGLARAFLVEHAGDLTELESAAIGRYLVDRERTLAKLRRTVGVPWRGVSSLAFRRSLGRLVAGL